MCLIFANDSQSKIYVRSEEKCGGAGSYISQCHSFPKRQSIIKTFCDRTVERSVQRCVTLMASETTLSPIFAKKEFSLFFFLSLSLSPSLSYTLLTSSYTLCFLFSLFFTNSICSLSLSFSIISLSQFYLSLNALSLTNTILSLFISQFSLSLFSYNTFFLSFQNTPT